MALVSANEHLEARIAAGGDVLRVRLLGQFQTPNHQQARLRIQALGDGQVVWAGELSHPRHLRLVEDDSQKRDFFGDGSCVETLGTADGAVIDLITIDLPSAVRADCIRISAASHRAEARILRIEVDHPEASVCPFRGGSGKIALSELPAIIRLADRPRFLESLAQLESGLRLAPDLDEARGRALTYLAVLTAASLEAGGQREHHLLQLQTARRLDSVCDLDSIVEASLAAIHRVASPLFGPVEPRNAKLIEQAMAHVSRNFGKRVTDAEVAGQLGLSTSHFRYLFREAAGMPFHQYLIAARLERARMLLRESDASVGEIAVAVGFSSVSHFSKAFAQKFDVCPSFARKRAATID